MYLSIKHLVETHSTLLDLVVNFDPNVTEDLRECCAACKDCEAEVANLNDLHEKYRIKN